MKKYLLTGLLAVILLAGEIPAEACTGWLAAGDHVTGGGTLIAKNRDWFYGDVTGYRLVTGSKGYRYLAMYSNQHMEGTKGGINEKGLTILDLSAPPMPEGERKKAEDRKDFGIDWLLENCGTVDEVTGVLAEQGPWNVEPCIMILSDAKKAAYIELGPDGQYAVRQTENGVLTHANLYQEADMLSLNPAPEWMEKAGMLDVALHCKARMATAEAQVASQGKLTLGDIKIFTHDPEVWYGDRVFQTYTTMAVYNHPDRGPVIWIRLANPGEKMREAECTLAEAMTGKILTMLR